MDFSQSLLAPEEGSAAAVERAAGQGAFVFICEHASSRLPASLGNLGLPDEALVSHIAWDPGALAIARLMSAEFDSPLVFQNFSRLAYDCNRPPESPAAMPEVSEIYRIPGNARLSDEAKRARVEALYKPFHAVISGLLDKRRAEGLPTVLVTVHSFTPVYHGVRRSVEIGILHDEDSRFADRMLAAAADRPRFNICRNEPYGPQDGVTHSLRLHALPRGIENVMIEVKNDLLKDKTGQEVMAGYLVELARMAMADRTTKAKTSFDA
jgi:predicted N-formylglutamate amidohydrolase